MRDMEEKILNIFRNNPTKELSTQFLTKELYPTGYSLAEDLMKSEDKVSSSNGKEKKFQLHRKTLYYLNKLADEKIIKVSKTADKGEKYFILIASEGDTIFEKGYRKILITKPALAASYIEKYESSAVMKKYEENSWINRFNSIMLECSVITDVNRLHRIVLDLFTNVNDAIALNDFDKILNTTPTKIMQDFLEKTSRDADSYSKIISIIINLSNVSSSFNEFIEHYAELNPRNINIIFNLSSREMQKQSKTIIKIFELFSSKKIKINIKNIELSKAPYFKGRAGIYTFDEHDWEIYSKKSRGKIIGISCSQSQIALNVSKFLEEYKTDTEFRSAVLNAAKTLLVASNIQRRKSQEYFRNINNLNPEHQHDFYEYSRNYIRFWNYDWHENIRNEDTIYDLIKSTKEIITSFCHNEETIFKSCGIPIRCRMAFSSAMKNYDDKFMGERYYKKATVNKIEDYYGSEIKSFLQSREKMFELFDGGDRIRIFRNSNFASNDIMHELGILLNAYRIPLFTYDFSGLRGMTKLTNFMEGR